jgi:glycosyltransferase involved in cell wall biosynthesis
MNLAPTGAERPLVAVCVCTRARPLMLRRCLASLRRQSLDGVQCRMTLVLVDNNPEPSARPIFEEVWKGADGELVHCPRPGIPMARNAALEVALRAGANCIAFLDDDEVAPACWLGSLVQALQHTGADAVQGGVRALATDADDAVTSAMPATDAAPAWEACESLATSNVLFAAWLVAPPLSLRFDETMQFTGGSDREFFMRAHKRGARLARVDGIDVLEDAHPERRTLAFQAARAFASGSNYFARMVRNETAPVAAGRIVLRALERSLSGVVKLLAATALLLALRPRSAGAQWRKGCLSLCFAAGCLTPVAGLRAHPYRTIQGA